MAELPMVSHESPGSLRGWTYLTASGRVSVLSPLSGAWHALQMCLPTRGMPGMT